MCKQCLANRENNKNKESTQCLKKKALTIRALIYGNIS